MERGPPGPQQATNSMWRLNFARPPGICTLLRLRTAAVRGCRKKERAAPETARPLRGRVGRTGESHHEVEGAPEMNGVAMAGAGAGAGSGALAFSPGPRRCAS